MARHWFGEPAGRNSLAGSSPVLSASRDFLLVVSGVEPSRDRLALPKSRSAERRRECPPKNSKTGKISPVLLLLFDFNIFT